VAENKKLYLSLPKKQKMLVAQNLVLGVRSLQPPGRFLQKDPKTGLWEDIGDAKAQDKASQALREGAPDIRDVLVLSSKDARSQQDDKSTINPFFSDHVVEVEGDAVVIFDAISHAAETEISCRRCTIQNCFRQNYRKMSLSLLRCSGQP